MTDRQKVRESSDIVSCIFAGFIAVSKAVSNVCAKTVSSAQFWINQMARTCICLVVSEVQVMITRSLTGL